MRASLLAFFAAICASAQSPAQAPAPSAPAAASMLIGVGINNNHYVPSATALWSKSIDFGVSLGNSGIWSVSSLTLQGQTGTLTTGLGYDFKKTGPFHVIVLMTAGVTQTTTTTTVGGTTTTTTSTSTAPPSISIGNINLGNVGGGLMLRYDLGSLWKPLKGLGVSAAFREAAVSGSNVSPELMFKLNYYLK